MATGSVVHRPNANGSSGKFELGSDGSRLGYLDYSLPDADTLCIDYVEVTPAMRGKLVGRQLVDAAVAWARSNDRAVTATCGYAQAVLDSTGSGRK